MATMPSSGGEKPPDQSQHMRNPMAYKPQLGTPSNSNPYASDLHFGDVIIVARNRNEAGGIFQHDSFSDFANRSHGVCSPHQEYLLDKNQVISQPDLMSSNNANLNHLKATMSEQLSPQHMVTGNTNKTNILKSSYAEQLHTKQYGENPAKLKLKPVTFDHGEATIKFTMEEINHFSKEEGLHQALIVKFSQEQYDMQQIRKLLPLQFGTHGCCLIGWLARRHVLVRFDRYSDYVIAIARAVNYVTINSRELQFIIFPWTLGFNPKEETSKAFVWISLPSLPPMLFAKKPLLSIASVVFRPIAIDKATQEKSRPSTARIKVELDLPGTLPQHLKVQFVDEKTGKFIEHVQIFVYDNLPPYCTFCKHQGHAKDECSRLTVNDAKS